MGRAVWIESVKRTLFGTGCVAQLGERLKELGLHSVILVLDKKMSNGHIGQRIKGILSDSGISFQEYADVTPEPAPELADRGAELARSYKVGGVLAVGGGSTMDVAKAIAVLATNPGRARDYIGLNLVKERGLPSIMVPTTAGTGSEATFTAVFTMREEKKKGGINSPYLYPELAVLDPELTVELPPFETAYTGMDALTHAIESYTSTSSHFLSRAISIKALELIAKNLRGAVYQGKNIHFRTAMLQGSYLGGLGLAMAGVGAVHAMAYPLGAFYDIPHGLANSVLLPYVMEYNYPADISAHAMISRLLGCEEVGDWKCASHLRTTLLNLQKDIGLPLTLRDLGVPKGDIHKMAEVAMGVTRPMANNPRPMGLEDVVKVYHRAYGD